MLLTGRIVLLVIRCAAYLKRRGSAVAFAADGLGVAGV